MGFRGNKTFQIRVRRNLPWGDTGADFFQIFIIRLVHRFWAFRYIVRCYVVFHPVINKAGGGVRFLNARNLIPVRERAVSVQSDKRVQESGINIVQIERVSKFVEMLAYHKRCMFVRNGFHYYAVHFLRFFLVVV